LALINFASSPFFVDLVNIYGHLLVEYQHTGPSLLLFVLWRYLHSL